MDKYSKSDLQILEDSWKQIRIYEDKLSDAHYEKLFQGIPGIEQLFKAPKLIQGRRVILSFNSILDNFFEDHSSVLGYIKSLGWRHKSYEVQRDHYPVFKDILIETFKEILGDQFDDKLTILWNNFLTDMNSLMIKGAKYRR